VTWRGTFVRGAVDMFPVMLGAVPFGLIVGVTCAGLGFGAAASTLPSMMIFAGASQLATYDLIAKAAPFVVVLFTAAFINLRFLVYSAAIAPVFRSERRWVRLLYAYLLTDQGYTMTAARRLKDPDAPHGGAYYLGGSLSLWVMWLITAFVGAYAGASIPPSWSLDFAVPLCFTALLVPAIADREQLLCALATAVVSLLALKAPHGSGVIISIVAGIAVGALLARRSPA
jgi:4-azaleucine resistance transporter AzlC